MRPSFSLSLWLLPFALCACGTATLDMGNAPDAGQASAPPDTSAADASPPLLDGGTDAPSFADEAKALGARWTWLDVPNPHETMFAVAGTSASDVYYAGTHGSVRYWDGRAWTWHVLDPDLRFLHAWAPSRGAVWLVAQDPDSTPHLGRFDGAMWTDDASMRGVTVQALSGVGPNLAWAVGARGEIRAWQNGAWTTTRAATGHWLRAVHGFAAHDVWAVGDRGQIVHYDGAAWSTPAGADAPNPLDADYMYGGVWGATPNDVWAVGMRFTSWTPVFSHFDGTRWSVASQPSGVCGDATDPHAYASSWWPRWSNIPWNENNLDQLIPFGPIVVGTSASQVMAITGCPFRFDGTRWQAEPPAWWKDASGALLATNNYDYAPIPSAPLAALGTDVLAFTFRLDPSVARAPADGHSPRWQAFLRQEHGLGGSALSVDGAGNLWSADVQVKRWTPSGWSSLDLSSAPDSRPYLLWGAGSSRHLLARSENDVWAGYYSSPNDSKRGVMHWDGASWTATDLGARATVLAANQVHVWTAGGNYPYPLHRFDAAGNVEASAELPVTPGGGVGGDIEEDVALLPDGDTGDRVYYAYVIFPGTVTGLPFDAQIVLGSWDGVQPPRVEQSSPIFQTNLAFELAMRLTRLPNGNLAVLTSSGLWEWTSSGLVRRIEAVVGAKNAFTNTNTCKGANGSVTVAWSDVGCELRDVAPAPAGRLWLAAGGAILLWDPVTEQLAEAVDNVGVRTFASGLRGEAFGAAYPPHGYNTGGSDTLHFVPPPDSSTR